MTAGFREGFAEADGLASGKWRLGKGRHSQLRERLQYGALQSIGDDEAYG